MELSDQEALRWGKHLKKEIIKMQDEALDVPKSISEGHKHSIREALQRMQKIQRLNDPHIYTGIESVKDAEKALTEHFHRLYEIGFSLDKKKEEWFDVLGKLTKCLGTGTLPKGKYKQITAARVIYEFLQWNKRPTVKSVLEAIHKYESREVTQDQITKMIENMGLKELFAQEKRGRK